MAQQLNPATLPLVRRTSEERTFLSFNQFWCVLETRKDVPDERKDGK
jgi:hypothetical protein